MDFVKTPIVSFQTNISKELLDNMQNGIVEGITKAEDALKKVEEIEESGGGGGGSEEITAENIKEALGYTPANESEIPKNPEDVGAEKAGAVNAHNVANDAHNDIRIVLNELKAGVEAFFNIDDAEFDQISELIWKIRDNAGSIEQLTNGKVNVSDIVNNLTTNVTNKPLSAAQGVVLKELAEETDAAATEAKTTAQNASNKVDDLEGRMDSGEFKGDKGDKGDPYTLTDSDKNTIAQAVYAIVADGNGVAY